MIFVGLKRYFISTISNHSLSVQLRVLTAETMEISASLNKLVVVKGQAGSTTEAVLFRSIFCKIRWEQQRGDCTPFEYDGITRNKVFRFYSMFIKWYSVVIKCLLNVY